MFVLTNAKRLVVVVPLAMFVLGGPAAADHDPTAMEVVGTDPAGDWGTPGLPLPMVGEAGKLLGQDLVAGALSTPDESHLRFEWRLAQLPSEQDLVRQSSYVWDFRVDGKWWRLTSFVCDPTSDDISTCSPETDAAPVQFELLRCGAPRVVNIFANCQPAASYDGAVSVTTARIAVQLPLEAVGAEAGSRIAPMSATRPSIAASFAPNLAPPRDELSQTKTFVVPSFEEPE